MVLAHDIEVVRQIAQKFVEQKEDGEKNEALAHTIECCRMLANMARWTTMAQHNYTIQMTWTGSEGKGTVDYRSYTRSYTIAADGKPDLLGSADAAYMGDASRWNPEEMLLGALSSCHMLWFLHLCTMQKIVVLDYQDAPQGVVEVDATGSGTFTEATLRPKITLISDEKLSIAHQLHEQAHKKCFIANSLNFPIKIEPEFHVA